MTTEKVITVTLKLRDGKNYDNKIKELRELVKSSGGEVIAEVETTRNYIDKTYYIGSGKAEEIADLAKKLEVKTIIFNNELSGSQMRNLEKIIDAKIIDRTNLILDIFASRAKSKESVLQVELAQLQYRLPRLIGFRDYLSREGAGIGTRGPGEQKLELDRRTIMRDINKIKKELKDIESNRNITRKNRINNKIPIISLVGYTNAGKSTIANKLIQKYKENENDEEEFMVKDMLFATLDTTLRKGILPDGEEFLIADTVGFVDDIPTNLIESFKSTLEEIKYADCILHIMDSSNENIDEQINVTFDILKQMDVLDKPIINVFNKKDKLNKDIDKFVHRRLDNEIYISAYDEDDVEKLMYKIQDILNLSYKEIVLNIPYDKQYIVDELINKYGHESLEYKNEFVEISLKIEKQDLEKYNKYISE